MSNPPRDSLSLPVPLLTTYHLSEFKFPYDHEKDEEKRELTAVAEDIRMTKATDPMKDVMWSGKDERFRLPPSFFSVLRGAPCD